jgi:hypothetical protein
MNKLIEFFNANQMPTAGSITIRTAVKMNKKDVATKTEQNPYDVIWKTQTLFVTFNESYTDVVNEQLRYEGKQDGFVAEKSTYGDFINRTILQNGEQLYVRVIANGTAPATYEHNGAQVNYSDFERFVPIRKPGLSQGTEEQVQVRNIKIENVKMIDFGGEDLTDLLK